MARDYEDIFDIEDLDDGELRRLVRETLRDNRSIDPDDITVHVRDGKVALVGRVGTDAEKRIAERLIADRLGLDEIENQLMVDPIRRSVSPEAADEHLVDEAEHEALLLGDRVYREDDEARHLTPDPEGELYGTTDRTEATERAMPWVPPESPTPEGMGGTGVEEDAERDSY